MQGSLRVDFDPFRQDVKLLHKNLLYMMIPHIFPTPYPHLPLHCVLFWVLSLLKTFLVGPLSLSVLFRYSHQQQLVLFSSPLLEVLMGGGSGFENFLLNVFCLHQGRRYLDCLQPKKGFKKIKKKDYFIMLSRQWFSG